MKSRDLRGILVRPELCPARSVLGCRVLDLIVPGRESRTVAGTRIDIPPRGAWVSDAGHDLETTGVIWDGRGEVELAQELYLLEAAATFYAPAGTPIRITALSTGLSVYLWRAPLPRDRRPSARPLLTSTLWDDTTSCHLANGEGDPLASEMMPEVMGGGLAPATMHFLHWPGTGSPLLGLHCGIQKPGEMFPVHRHPHSEELFIGFRGVGECYANGTWQPMRAGDVLFAPPGHLHGARNARRDGAPFVTCGGPTPFDPNLYRLAGVSPDVR